MAEERDLVPAGAPVTVDADDPEATKQELQRRMEEAREQISQTVTEIKETVVNQYQQVRSSINESLDWREQVRRRPVPFAVGAFGAGVVVGYTVAGAIKEGSEDDEGEGRGRVKGRRSGRSPYAASPITAQAAAFGASDLSRPALPPKGATTPGAPARASADVGPETRATTGGNRRPAEQSASEPVGFADLGASAAAASPLAEEAKGPGLFERFKETKAYDRLQDELATVGNRVVEELSRTAQTVVVPALLGKLKDLIGIDLGTQRQVAERTRVETQAAQEQQRAAQATEAHNRETSGGQASGGSANYAASGGRNA